MRKNPWSLHLSPQNLLLHTEILFAPFSAEQDEQVEHVMESMAGGVAPA